MTQPVPPQGPGARRPPQVWDTRFDPPPSPGPSGAQGFGPAPVPHGPGDEGGDTGRGRRKALLVVLTLALVAGLAGGGLLLRGGHGKTAERNAGQRSRRRSTPASTG